MRKSISLLMIRLVLQNLLSSIMTVVYGLGVSTFFWTDIHLYFYKANYFDLRFGLACAVMFTASTIFLIIWCLYRLDKGEPKPKPEPVKPVIEESEVRQMLYDIQLKLDQVKIDVRTIK